MYHVIDVYVKSLLHNHREFYKQNRSQLKHNHCVTSFSHPSILKMLSHALIHDLIMMPTTTHLIIDDLVLLTLLYEAKSEACIFQLVLTLVDHANVLAANMKILVGRVFYSTKPNGEVVGTLDETLGEI